MARRYCCPNDACNDNGVFIGTVQTTVEIMIDSSGEAIEVDHDEPAEYRCFKCGALAYVEDVPDDYWTRLREANDD